MMTLREFLRTELAAAFPAKDGGPDLRAASDKLGVKYTTLYSYAQDTTHPRLPSPRALGHILDGLRLGERKRSEARRLLEAADADRTRGAALGA
jgi:hypothetical protein